MFHLPGVQERHLAGEGSQGAELAVFRWASWSQVAGNGAHRVRWAEQRGAGTGGLSGATSPRPVGAQQLAELSSGTSGLRGVGREASGYGKTVAAPDSGQ